MNDPREERHYAARVLGATAADIARFEGVAQAFGPRTTMPNTEVYEAIWFTGLHWLKLGLPLIPTNAEQWAGAVWLSLCQVGAIRSYDPLPIFQIRETSIALWSME